jgi:hypothetical protein
LSLADALATLVVECLQAVPDDALVAGACVAITFPTLAGNQTVMSFTTHSRLATPQAEVLREIGKAILARADAEAAPPASES